MYPYRFRDASAAAFAATRGALLAVGRREAGASGVSLSPLSVRQAARTGPLVTSRKLVLPSPNGSAISRQLAESRSSVVGACLRNARAVAEWISRGSTRGPIAVVGAGERWPGDLLRPAVEDLWGAGAVIDALLKAGVGPASPEARAAAAAYRELGQPSTRPCMPARPAGNWWPMDTATRSPSRHRRTSPGTCLCWWGSRLERSDWRARPALSVSLGSSGRWYCSARSRSDPCSGL